MRSISSNRKLLSHDMYNEIYNSRPFKNNENNIIGLTTCMSYMEFRSVSKTYREYIKGKLKLFAVVPDQGYNNMTLLGVGIGVKWQYLPNHVAPDLFFAYRPQYT